MPPSSKLELVLSNSGHIQSILNPPGNPKASFFSGAAQPADADQWLSKATKHAGSWWEHWQTWIKARSGNQKEAPDSLGNQDYLPVGEAPGAYVYE